MFGKIFNSKKDYEVEDGIENILFKPALNSSHDAFIITKNNRVVIYTNHTMKKIYMIQNGTPIDDLQDYILFSTPVIKNWSSIKTLLEYHNKHNNGESTLFVGSKIKYGNNEISGLSLQIKSLEDEDNIYHIFTIHNPLDNRDSTKDLYRNAITGLPNQNKAFADISVLTTNISENNHFAVFILEIDNFSKLRSILGYKEMNNLIILIANRLKELSKEDNYSVYQLIHENFLIIVKDIETPTEIYNTAEYINSIFDSLRNMNPNNRNLSFSIGVSRYPQNGTLDNLIDSAYSALNKAQEKGEGQVVIAQSEEKHISRKDMIMASDIKDALENRHIRLYFQPIYNQPHYKIAGAEVLIRWHHPKRGIIMPDSFIPLAEKSGMIVDITMFVLNEAMKQLKNWKTFGFKPIELSVNLSARDFENDKFVDNVKTLVDKYDIAPFKLKAEVTEHTSMINPHQTSTILNALKDMKIDISLDDFGTGYSSFEYLTDFPIDSLKIDKSFIIDIGKNEKHRKIVSSMVKLAHSLDMSVIAEGVEKKDDLELLQEFGVDFFQGYYFSKPIPLLEFQHLLTQDNKK